MHLFVLIACGILSVISGLIPGPMMKPDGSVDIANLLNHVTLLEQTVTSFQTKTNQLETEMQSTKTELQVTKAKLQGTVTNFVNYQQSSTAEITSLKGELAAVKLELRLTKNDVISVKTELTDLKKESIKSQINFTVIHSISHDVKSNMENLKHLETDLHSIKLTQDKTNTSIESFLTTLMDVNETTADIQQHQFEMKTEISKLSSLQKQLLSNINTTVHNVSHIKDNIMTVQSQLIMTKNDIGLIKTDMATLENESRTLTVEQTVIENMLLNISSVLNQVKSSEASTAANLTFVKEDVRTVQSQLSSAMGDVKLMKSEIGIVTNESNTLKKEQVVIKTDIANISSAMNQVQSSAALTAGNFSHLNGDIRTVQSQLSTTTGDISQIRSDVTVLGRNISWLEMTSQGNSKSLTQLSQTLALKTKDVSFHVYLSGSQSETATKFQPVKFNDVNHNAGNGYNTSTGKFTAPVNGTYVFSAIIQMVGSKQNTYVYIQQSVSYMSSFQGIASSATDDIPIPVTTITHVRQGEQVWVTTSEDVDLYAGDYDFPTRFGGALLHED